MVEFCISNEWLSLAICLPFILVEVKIQQLHSYKMLQKCIIIAQCSTKPLPEET